MTPPLGSPPFAADSGVPQARRQPPPPQRTAAGRRLFWPGALALTALALFALGYLPKREQRVALAQDLVERAKQPERVALIKPKAAPAEQKLSLAGNVQGLEETLVYARADGYVKSFHADLGDSVKQGQVLAELDTPEAQRELEQARESVAQGEAALARAQAKHAQSLATLGRYQALAAGLASREELDQRETQARLDDADVKVAQAALSAQRASFERRKLQQAYALVRAPFDGTITARNVERGSLVAAGRSQALFKITALDSLRIFVQVPQNRVPGVRTGLPAQVQVAEYPTQVFAGTVNRTASALDAGTRTLTVEVRLPNPKRVLLPGMYASVSLPLEGASAGFLVPATALIIGEQGVKVASLDAEGKVRILPVQIARDRGSEIELASGLTGQERIIVNPRPSLREGAQLAAAGGV